MVIISFFLFFCYFYNPSSSDFYLLQSVKQWYPDQQRQWIQNGSEQREFIKHSISYNITEQQLRHTGNVWLNCWGFKLGFDLIFHHIYNADRYRQTDHRMNWKKKHKNFKLGFGMLESGCVSIKNEVNIMMKNIVDIVLGGLVFLFHIIFIFSISAQSETLLLII